MRASVAWARAASATCLAVAMLSAATTSFAGGASSAPSTSKKASAPPDAASAVENSGPRDSSLIYAPYYLPSRTAWTPSQLDALRSGAASQVESFHAANVAKNRANAAEEATRERGAASAALYVDWTRQHTEQVLESQSAYSRIIFWMVVLIVLLSLSLTIYQFTRDRHQTEQAFARLLEESARSDKSEGLTVEAIKALSDSSASNKEVLLEYVKLLKAPSTVSIGPAGFQLGSQIVGLLLLSFALAFFYLYLQQVYPVSFHEPAYAAATPLPPASSAPAASAIETPAKK